MSAIPWIFERDPSPCSIATIYSYDPSIGSNKRQPIEPNKSWMVRYSSKSSEAECADCRGKFSFLRRKYKCARCMETFCKTCLGVKNNRLKRKETLCGTCTIVLHINEPSLTRSETQVLENGVNQTSLGNNELSVWSSHSKSLKRYQNHIPIENDRFLDLTKEKRLRALHSHESLRDNEENNSTFQQLSQNIAKKNLTKRVSFASSTISFPSESQEFLENDEEVDNNEDTFYKEQSDEILQLRDFEQRKQRVLFASKLCDLEQERQVSENKAFNELDRDERRYNQTLSIHLMEQERARQIHENETWLLHDKMFRHERVSFAIQELDKEKYRRMHSSPRQLQCPWVSNKSRVECKSCKSEFWLLNRRHHCRLCGDIYDSKCCGVKINIPFRYKSSERVCVLCNQFRQELKSTLEKIIIGSE